MNKRTLSWADYWRNSLADASLGLGTFRVRDIDQFQKLTLDAFERGVVDNSLLETLFKDIDEETQAIAVLLRPYVYTYRIEHGSRKNDGLPDFITPLLCFANLSRSGKLYPSSRPVVPRDILEPLEAKTYSIGAVANLDAFLSKESFTELARTEGQSNLDDNPINKIHSEYWQKYRSYCDKLINVVAGDWLSNPQDYVKADYGIILNTDNLHSTVQHVLRLYDHLRRTVPTVPLFNTYTHDTAPPLKQTLEPNSLLAKRLAHASDQYGLTKAQRDALSHILSCTDGDILAINGPPGTGKTTLVLSLVASLWAKAAIAGDDTPPVIIATSANNQATSNVIDAFGKDFSEGTGPLAGRWLPQISSYGAYFPSQYYEEKKSGDKYQTERFFKSIENQVYLESAELYYKEKAQQLYDDQQDLSISDIVERLRRELTFLSGQLTKAESTWMAYLSALADHAHILGDNADERMTTIVDNIQTNSETINLIKHAQLSWSKYLAQEPIWYTLFSWLPPVRKKRERVTSLFIRENLCSLYNDTSSIDIYTLEQDLKLLLADKQKTQQVYKHTKASYDAVINKLSHCKSALKSIANQFGLSRFEPIELNILDEYLDATVRFKIFRLTVHYWEGRWLLDVRDRLKEVVYHGANGLKAKQKRWRRRMMVTPCIVSTLYMLPAQMTGTKREDDQSFSLEYNYNFIDLLIIDEAGLIPPELAGASLSLAKQAVVIGDTRQIEPIQSLSSQIDMGNLHHAELLPRDYSLDQYNHLKNTGKTVLNGSAMKAAQMLSHYHYDLDMERGMYLYEHRRCYNDIINFCNELCYEKKLIPKRGNAPKNAAFPTIGHLHIDGLCQKTNGGSRFNILEAQTIAQWLADHRQQLESSYEKSLSEIVCVITPFGNQTEVISRACRHKGIKVGKGEDQMVVGTVHAIQGAERPIVILSPVYSKHADGLFIDRSNSMLNVAVSRAKDHFFVFGDMDVFTMAQGDSSPRGILANYLFRSPHNAIEYPVLPRTDLIYSQPVTPLYNAEAHDKFLIGAVNSALDEIHIVTPWIRKSFLENSAVLQCMADANSRKVAVRVYTDFDLNCQANNHQETKHKRKQLLSLRSWLQDYGIHLLFVKRVHSKIVMIDSNLLCIGSFNWFSASRQGPYVRHETSLVYNSSKVKRETEVIIGSLKSRVVPTYD